MPGVGASELNCTQEIPVTAYGPVLFEIKYLFGRLMY